MLQASSSAALYHPKRSESDPEPIVGGPLFDCDGCPSVIKITNVGSVSVLASLFNS